MNNNTASVVNTNIRYSGSWWKKQHGIRSFFSYTERFHANDAVRSLRMFSPSCKKILDIGFGGGVLLEKLLHLYNSNSPLVLGLDVSPETVNQYNRRIAASDVHGIFAIEADPFRSLLPFKTGSLDCVVCSHVMEHVADDILLEKEVCRVLKKGGIALIMIPINEEACDVPTHVRKYKADTIIDRLGKSFIVEHTRCNDCVSDWIRFYGTKNRAVFTVLKKVIVFKASLIPFPLMVLLDKILLKAGYKPSQLCIVCRK
jgi:SAM-dependent methyltransferase